MPERPPTPSFKQAQCQLTRQFSDGSPSDMAYQIKGSHVPPVSAMTPCRAGLVAKHSKLLLQDATVHRTCLGMPLNPGTFRQRITDPRRLRAMKVRAAVEQEVRAFFTGREFTETRTPLLVPCPGMETHIRPISTSRGSYLPTSPEFSMKKLLVGGLERIFQICPAFRDEPHSAHHSPEFTLLEWYRAHSGYEEVMRDTEELIAGLAVSLLGKPFIHHQGRKIDVSTPWPRLKVRDLFLEQGVDLIRSASPEAMRAECIRLGLDPGSAEVKSWDDYTFLIWLNLIEPRLPQDRAVFVMLYPPSQAALAVLQNDPDGTRWARRFEAYAGGLELCNAFEELTDPLEQRRRFEADMELREKTYGAAFPRTPLDEGFLTALEEGMPPSGGNALGVDRLVMLLADEPDIDYTLWLPSV